MGVVAGVPGKATELTLLLEGFLGERFSSFSESLADGGRSEAPDDLCRVLKAQTSVLWVLYLSDFSEFSESFLSRLDIGLLGDSSSFSSDFVDEFS